MASRRAWAWQVVRGIGRSVLGLWPWTIPVVVAIVVFVALARIGALPPPLRQIGAPTGADLYARNCAQCHGAKGSRIPATPLDSPAYLFKLGEASLAKTITEGKGTMPAWGRERGGPLNDEEVRTLVVYLGSPERLEGPGRQLYLGHCASCHGDKGSRIPAVPLNSQSYVDQRSDADLIKAIAEGKGTMPAFGRGREGTLHDNELVAVTRYIRLLAGSVGPAATGVGPDPAAGAAAGGEGKEIYSKQCAMCHGPTGNKLANANLASPEYLQTKGAGLAQGIADGKGSMPGFADKLSAAQITAIVDFLKAAAGGGGGGTGAGTTPAAPAAPASGQAVKPGSTRAADLFKANCASCHASLALPQVDPTQVHTIISEGLSAKGMPAYRDKLSREDIEALANFIVSGATEAGADSAAGPFSGVIRHVDGWIIKHPSIVKDSGAQLCYKCHQNTFCATCHTGGRIGP